MSNQLDWSRYTRWTWIIALLALIVLLWMWMSGRGPNAAGCCGAPTVTAAATPEIVAAAPAAAPVTAIVPTTIAQAITASWNGDKLTLEGVVGSEQAKKAMLDAAITKYGAGNVVDKLNVDAAVKGDVKITLTGEVDSDAAKAARGADAQAFYAGSVIDNQLVVKAVVVPAAVPAPEPVTAASIPAASAADVKCGDKIAIAAYFATGSAKLTNESAKLLNAVVPCIKAPFEIGGHTDSKGGVEFNRVLSELRARTVSGYLVRKGVDPKMLKIKGYGASSPIADNETEVGRAKNRRIEFTKM